MGEAATAGSLADSGERAQFAWDESGNQRVSARVNTARRSGEWVRFDLNDGSTLELRAEQPIEIIS